jgi:hypothetical protein
MICDDISVYRELCPILEAPHPRSQITKKTE